VKFVETFATWQRAGLIASTTMHLFGLCRTKFYGGIGRPIWGLMSELWSNVDKKELPYFKVIVTYLFSLAGCTSFFINFAK